MSKVDVVKWYSAMLTRFALVTVLVAFYSAEFFTSVV